MYTDRMQETVCELHTMADLLLLVPHCPPLAAPASPSSAGACNVHAEPGSPQKAGRADVTILCNNHNHKNRRKGFGDVLLEQLPVQHSACTSVVSLCVVWHLVFHVALCSGTLSNKPFSIPLTRTQASL